MLPLSTPEYSDREEVAHFSRQPAATPPANARDGLDDGAAMPKRIIMRSKPTDSCLFRFICWNRPYMDAAFQNGPLPSLRPSWGRVMEASMRVHRLSSACVCRRAVRRRHTGSGSLRHRSKDLPLVCRSVGAEWRRRVRCDRTPAPQRRSQRTPVHPYPLLRNELGCRAKRPVRRSRRMVRRCRECHLPSP